MGTVKYSGPMASFHCPTNAEIRSLKVHFSPKQEGSGDPSPENVRAISGWDGVKVYKAKKNIGHIIGYSVYTINNVDEARYLTGNYGTTISTIDYNLPDTALIITQTQGASTPIYDYHNGYFCIGFDNLVFNSYYDISFKITNITNNLLNANLTDIQIQTPGGAHYAPPVIINNNTLLYKNVQWRQYTYNEAGKNRCSLEIRNCGMSFTLSEIMITPANTSNGIFEPYQGDIVDYEFGVLGKNRVLFDAPKTITNTTYNGYSGWSQPWLIPNRNLKYTYSVAIDNTNGTTDATASVWFRDKNNENFVDGVVLSGTKITAGTSGTSYITIDCSTLPNTYYLCFGLTTFSNTGTVIFSEPMVELGDTATTYEPYNPNHTAYGDNVDLISGTLTTTSELLEITKDSEIGYNGTMNLSGIPRYIFYKVVTDEYKSPSICNMSSGTMTAEFVFLGTGLGMLVGRNDAIGILSRTDLGISGSAESFKQWLGDNTLQIILPRKTPITYNLTPTQLQTFLGQNHVWSNADSVEVEYDLHETQDILNRKAIIMANQPHLETASGALAQFKTDVRAPLKECKVYFSPIQDLHGYSNPWPAGGGKNLCDGIAYEVRLSSDVALLSTNAEISSPHTTLYTWAGAGFFAPVKTGITYTLTTDASSESNNIYYAIYATINDALDKNNALQVGHAIQPITITSQYDGYILFMKYNSSRGATVTWSYAQCEEGSTATSYEPYENVCPISGWTGANINKTGINIWDEEWEIGDISNITGENMGSNNQIRSVNYMSVAPNTNYRCVFPPMKDGQKIELKILSYDINKHYIRYLWRSNTSSVYTTSNDTYYIRLVTIKAYGTTYNNDISINYPSTDTDYHTYTGNTYTVQFPATKNLFNENQLLQASNFAIDNNGYYTGTWSDFNLKFGDGFLQQPIYKENTQYTLSIYGYTNSISSGVDFDIYYTDDTHSNLRISGTVPSQYTLTTTAGKTIQTIKGTFGSGYANIMYLKNIQLEEGTTATTYEPYGIMYGGYIDLIEGKLVVTTVGADMGNLSWQKTKLSLSTELYVFNIEVPDINISKSLMCECYKYNPAILNIGYLSSINNYEIVHIQTPNSKLWIMLRDDDKNNLTGEEFQTIMTGTLITYELETPIIYNLTPQQIKTIKGANNIYSNTNGNIELSYWAH